MQHMCVKPGIKVGSADFTDLVHAAAAALFQSCERASGLLAVSACYFRIVTVTTTTPTATTTSTTTTITTSNSNSNNNDAVRRKRPDGLTLIPWQSCDMRRHGRLPVSRFLHSHGGAGRRRGC